MIIFDQTLIPASGPFLGVRIPRRWNFQLQFKDRIQVYNSNQ